ncbi:FCD domain-containing protein [Variovorax guangxiensis]|uniref:FCD domain-containing protein n=1 Tax=Variovorax guangxiensis TaxID=1775474 RepID=UPI0038F612E6
MSPSTTPSQACGNRFFGMTMTALAPQTHFCIGLSGSLAGRPRDSRRAGVCQEHAAIEAALKQQDAAAARQAMEAHLRGGIARLFGSGASD